MAHLIYSAITSLDGYVEDREGKFEWAAPDEEVLAFVNDLERPVDTYFVRTSNVRDDALLGDRKSRREQPALLGDFTEIWQAAEKIVYSRTLASVSSARTRIERHFDANAVRHLKETSERDLTVGGANLAAQVIKAGLVDELQLFVVPVVVGGGKSWLPEDLRLKLQLLETRRFAKGTVYLRYCPEPMIAT
jgi:dihydrofolate reductase